MTGSIQLRFFTNKLPIPSVIYASVSLLRRMVISELRSLVEREIDVDSPVKLPERVVPGPLGHATHCCLLLPCCV
jgi:hypothetical protein